MSAQEIIKELEQLPVSDLVEIKHSIERLMTPTGGTSVREVFKEFAGTAEGLPADLAEQHDHYLYGNPRKE